MAPDELAIVRPTRAGSRPRPIGDESFRRAVGRSSLSWVRTVGHDRPGRPSLARARLPALSRRAFVKVYVAGATPASAAAAARHLTYIARDGVERSGGRGVLYGPEGPALAAAFRTPRPREKRQFRLTISPEDGYELDLTAFVRRFMARVEEDLGQRLEWAAVNHHDTGHAHAHVVLRGVDRDGFEVRLDRRYMFHGLRWRAQTIATEELGPRLAQEAERWQEVTRERYTVLDRELALRERDHEVSVRAGAAPEPPPGLAEGLLVARLAHLERYRLAHRKSVTSWILTPGWAETLQEIEARCGIVERMHQTLHSDPARYRIVFPGRKLEPTPADRGPVLTGRVVRSGPWDERRGNFYVVLETPAGSGYQLSVDARSAECLRTGDLVSFATRPERPRRPGTPRYHVELRKLALGIDEQVPYRGPVWLDTVRSAPLAVYGFGVEVRRALQRRDSELRSLGIDPSGREHIGRLGALERLALGREIARRTGETFLERTPATFRGRVDLAGNRSIAPLAIVSDGSRFILVAATRELRLRLGSRVTLECRFDFASAFRGVPQGHTIGLSLPVPAIEHELDVPERCIG
ncbi:MAG TPA: DUF3363 domain-containing protein [Polyangiaceae bacterium]|nr:DUF3363 domain-containing protein [Polyangiaceae bacterium]